MYKSKINKYNIMINKLKNKYKPQLKILEDQRNKLQELEDQSYAKKFVNKFYVYKSSKQETSKYVSYYKIIGTKKYGYVNCLQIHISNNEMYPLEILIKENPINFFKDNCKEISKEWFEARTFGILDQLNKQAGNKQ